MIAALFVEADGIYSHRPDVDCWDIVRDARTYTGSDPVVAHPPCQVWGNFARSGMTLRPLGDDDGCFTSALANVRRCGGVLEHPAESSAWAAHALARPLSRGWHTAGDGIGWTCRVEQGHYGHRARKATWLYAAKAYPPSLVWGPSQWTQTCERMGKKERLKTPPAFAEILLAIARSVTR